MKLPFPFSRRSLYSKLVISLTVTVTVLILGLSLLLYRIYSSASLDTINRMNTSGLSQISYSTQYLDNLAKKFTNAILISPYTSILLYHTEENMYLLGEALRNLQILTLPNDYVQSVYTINLTLDRVVSTDPSTFNSAAEFFDPDIIEIVKKIDLAAPAEMPIARTLPNSLIVGPETQYVNVYSYIFPYGTDSDIHPDKAVVVNIKADVLRELIASLKAKSAHPGNEIVVFDANGTIVSHSLRENEPNKTLPEAYIRKIFSFGQPTGHFKAQIDGQTYNVNFVASDKPNWTFVSLTSYKSFMSPVEAVKKSTMISCLAVLLLGLIFSVMMSKSIYSPVYSLIHTVRKRLSSSFGKDSSSDEIRFLQRAFGEMMVKSDELERKQRDQKQIVRNGWLKDILLGHRYVSDAELPLQQAEYGIKVNLNGPVALVLFRLDRYRAFLERYDERDRSLLKFAVANIINDLASTQYPNDIIELEADKLVLLLETDLREQEATGQQNLRRLVSAIQSMVKQYLRFSLSATIGVPIQSRDQINKVYSLTLNLAMYRLFCGHNSILTADYWQSIKQEQPPFPENKAKMMLDALKLGHLEKAMKHYEDCIQSLSGATYENMMSSLTHLMFLVRSHCGGAAESGDSRIAPLIQGFFANIDLYETMDEIHETFERLFAEIVQVAENGKLNKRGVAMTRVFRIMHERYRDKNLSLRAIADELQMSGDYLGKQVKETTGKSVMEHITDIRMAQVKHLLDTSPLSTKEILDKCGLEDTNYFYTLFKKHFGMSLSQYRHSGKKPEQ